MININEDNSTTLFKPNPNRVYIFERDIDLLLLEEFYSSVEFQLWFAAKVVASQQYNVPEVSQLHFVDARHSVVDITDRETDLLITYASKEGQKWQLLLEDKIDAVFQKDQVQSYQKRGEAAKSIDGVSWTTTVLVAPQKYFGGPEQKHGFQARVTYEEIADEWFVEKSNLGRRGEYKAYILKTAIEKAGTGGSNPVIMKFCLEYWALADTRLPELKIPKPTQRTSTWTSIPLPGKAEKATLVHKMGEGKMDLQFNDMALRLDELSQRFAAYLGNGVKVVAAGKSGVLRLEVPPLNVYEPFEDQLDAAYQGLVAALRLIRIYENGGKFA